RSAARNRRHYRQRGRRPRPSEDIRGRLGAHAFGPESGREGRAGTESRRDGRSRLGEAMGLPVVVALSWTLYGPPPPPRPTGFAAVAFGSATVTVEPAQEPALKVSIAPADTLSSTPDATPDATIVSSIGIRDGVVADAQSSSTAAQKESAPPVE